MVGLSGVMGMHVVGLHIFPKLVPKTIEYAYK